MQQPWKHVLLPLLLCATFFGMTQQMPAQAAPTLAPPAFTLDPAPLFINEFHYDNTGTDVGEFIEIAGPAGTDLTGWSIVLYNGNGGSVYDTDSLSGLIPDLGGGFGVVVVNYSGNLQNGAPDGIALIDSSNAVVQFLSYEGAFVAVGGAADGLTSTDISVFESGSEPVGQSLQLSGIGSFYADFAWNPPASATPGAFNSGQSFVSGDAQPVVASTEPASDSAGIALDANITVNFSENVTLSGQWFDITCTSSGNHSAVESGGPQAYVLDPETDFVTGESCTVTIFASQVADQDGPADNMATDHLWNFLASPFGACFDGNATPIHAVQGSGQASPLLNAVVAVEGVVVGDYQGNTPLLRGFYLQEENADTDGDVTTSEGIFVFSNIAVNIGDMVRVEGTVTEFGAPGLSLTELTNVERLQVCASGAAVTPVTITLPVASLEVWEQLEGMLVNLPQQLTVTEHFTLGRFGEVHLSSGGRLFQPTHLVAPGAPALAQQELNNRNRILLDDAQTAQNPDPVIYPAPFLSASNTLRTGYTVENITGILDQRFDEYRIQPIGAVAFNPANPRPEIPEEVGGTLKVASANVFNYFTTLDDGGNDCGPIGAQQECRGANNAFEFGRQHNKIIAALAAINADIVGLVEIENNETAALQSIIDGLNGILGAGTYAYIHTGFIGTDAIKTAFIYKPATVNPVGNFAILDSTVDPLFIDTLNRPVLAQTFEASNSGERFTVAVNHLKSKGSDCNDVGDPDIGDGQGNCNVTRTNAAVALANWLATDPTASGDPDYLIIGDLNSYALEDPITALKNAGYTDLSAHFHGPAAYSYVFDGQSGYLDHALASATLLDQVTGITDWHVNADEPIVLDYNEEFKSAAQIDYFFAPDAYRFSDHDPLVVGLDMNPTPTTTSITIVKDARPDNGRNFRFGGSLGRFRLDDSGSGENDPFGPSITFEVAAGTYTVFEEVPHRWHLTSIVCEGGSNVVDFANDSVAITVAEGENATCVFTNEYGSDLLVHTYHDSDANGHRLREPGLGGWEISLYDYEDNWVANNDTNGGGKTVFRNIAPGQYTVCETLQEGWFNSEPGTIDPDYNQPCYDLTIAPAELWIVEFGNHRNAQMATVAQQATAAPRVIQRVVENVDDERYEDDGTFVDRELERLLQGDERPMFLPQVMQ